MKDFQTYVLSVIMAFGFFSLVQQVRGIQLWLTACYEDRFRYSGDYYVLNSPPVYYDETQLLYGWRDFRNWTEW